MTDDQPNTMTSRTRDQHGRYAREVATADRDAEATTLRSRGMSYRAIGAELGMSASSAYEAVRRCLNDTLAEPADELRTLELERLDRLHVAAWEVLETKHLTVSHGRVVYLGDEPLVDDGPVLAAVDRLLRIAERRARLLGLDSPVKAEVRGTLRYEVVSVDLEAL